MAEATGVALDKALKFDLAYRLKGINQAVRPMSLSQVAFMNALLHSDRSLLFGVGPTGTGKTHLAIAAGLAWSPRASTRTSSSPGPACCWRARP